MGLLKNIEVGAESLDKISGISNDLKDFHNHFKGEMERNNLHISEISITLNEIKSKSNKDKPVTTDPINNFDKNEILSILLDGKDDTFYIGFLMNYYGTLSDRNSNEDTEFYISSLNEVESKVEDKEGVKYSGVSFFITVQDILLRLGIVVYNDGLSFNKDVVIDFHDVKDSAYRIKTSHLWRKKLIELLISGIEKKIN